MSIYSLRYCKYHGLTTFTQSSEKSKCICRMCSIERTTMQRKKRKKMLVDLKGGKCEICGYDKCIEALEFHHLDPNKKEINISNSSIHDIELFKKEIDKCILVCSNCHKEIHAEIEREKKRKLQEEFDKKIKEIPEEELKRLNKKIIFNIEEVKKYIEDGLTQAKICTIYNCSVATLKRFLKENNISMLKTKNHPSKEEFDEYMKKHTVKDFILKYKIDSKTYYKWKNKYYS